MSTDSPRDLPQRSPVHVEWEVSVVRGAGSIDDFAEAVVASLREGTQRGLSLTGVLPHKDGVVLVSQRLRMTRPPMSAKEGMHS